MRKMVIGIFAAAVIYDPSSRKTAIPRLAREWIDLEYWLDDDKIQNILL